MPPESSAAVTLTQPGKFTAHPAEQLAPPKAGFANVRVHRVGICGTDQHAFRGRQPFFSYPRMLGHELGVVVTAVGDDGNAQNVRVGDKCTVEPYLNCGRCEPCQLGRGNCCEHLQVLGVHVDGGMRPELTVPISKLHASRKLTLDQLALVEPLAIGAHAVARAALTDDDRVLVIGAGPIGLSTLQFAQLAGVAVVVADISEQRLAFCRQQMDVAHCLSAGDGDFVDELRRALGGKLPTVVFDATGSAASMARAPEFAAHGGRVVFVGLVQDDVALHDPLLHRKELTLHASRNALPGDFQNIIRLIEDGRINTQPWVTHRADPKQMIEQFPQWVAPNSGVVKAMVHWAP